MKNKLSEILWLVGVSVLIVLTMVFLFGLGGCSTIFDEDRHVWNGSIGGIEYTRWALTGRP